MAFSYISVSFLVKTFSIFSFGLVKKNHRSTEIRGLFLLSTAQALQVAGSNPGQGCIVGQNLCSRNGMAVRFSTQYCLCGYRVEKSFFYIYIDHHSAKKNTYLSETCSHFRKMFPFLKKIFFFISLV